MQDCKHARLQKLTVCSLDVLKKITLPSGEGTLEGPTGPEGLPGLDGMTGPTGPAGSGGSAVRYQILSQAAEGGQETIANTTGLNEVAIVTFQNPQVQVDQGGVTVDGSNQVFTIPETGLYRVVLRFRTDLTGTP